MKNEIIFKLARRGIGSLRYKGLEPKSAFKVVSFCIALDKAVKAVNEEREEIIKRTLRDRAEGFNRWRQWLQTGGERPSDLISNEVAAQCSTDVLPLINEYLAQDTEIKTLSPLTFDEFYTLVEQNGDLLDAEVSALVEGYLWTTN